MSHLEVPGASLYHEVIGEGPLLLCISGADGSVEIWKQFAAALKDRYRLVLYDRRGFSRSHLSATEPQDYAHRFETDADDAAALITHLSSNAPIHVIGNSSGALVALKLLSRHPDRIATLLSYEPPASTLLPDHADVWKVQTEIYNLYRTRGLPPAFAKFAQVTGMPAESFTTFIESMRHRPYVAANVMYWFEREFMHYPNQEFDVEGEFRPVKDKLMLLNGEESRREAYQVRANGVLAERLGLEVMIVPGGHIGYSTDPEAFADRICKGLEGRK